MGEVLDLTVSWGNQARLKCRECKRYLGRGHMVICKCGVVYRKKDEDKYEVVSVP